MNNLTVLTSPIKLSILLPSYNYKDGLMRILRHLEPCIQDDIEILIGDNSTNTEISETIAPWLEKYPNKIRYSWNNPIKTPIENWNYLVDESTGEYVWMIHHDEYPESHHIVKELLKSLKVNPSVDIFLLHCHLTFAGGFFSRSHFNVKIRDWLIKRNPFYLLRRNVIGPTGILVARRSLYPRFDLKLIWLVDVDMYVRLFSKTSKWISCPHIAIYSEQERTTSLTRGLGGSIKNIRVEELGYLQKKMHSHDIWIGPYRGEGLTRKLLRSIETMIWYTYRFLTKTIASASYRLSLKK